MRTRNNDINLNLTGGLRSAATLRDYLWQPFWLLGQRRRTSLFSDLYFPFRVQAQSWWPALAAERLQNPHRDVRGV